jgi:hypothetical protein
MKLLEEHLVSRHTEIRRVSVVQDQDNVIYLLHNSNMVYEITEKEFNKYDKELRHYINYSANNKTPVIDWLNKMGDDISVRLKNILIKMEFNYPEFKYVEDIKYNDILKQRNAGIKTANEFFEVKEYQLIINQL